MHEAIETEPVEERTIAPLVPLCAPNNPSQKIAPEEAKGGRRLSRRFLSPFRRLNRRRLLAFGILLLLLLPGAILLGKRCWALHHLRVGRALLERYHQHEARPHLEASLRLWPDNAQALLLLARASRQAEILDVADEYLETYRRIHGQTEELSQEQVFQAAARGDVDKVRRYCQNMVREDSPAAPLALEAMVQGYLRLFRLTEGYSVLQTWQERQPENTQALLYEAGLRTLLLQHTKSVALYQRILELDPEHDVARGRLALVLLEDRKYEEALPHLESLRRRQSDNLATTVQLARCLDFLGNQAEAERLLEEVLTREPHFSQALAERGRLALREGQNDLAEACLRAALEQEPGNHELLYQVILCLDRNGKTDEAQVGRQLLEKLKTNLKRIEAIANKEMQKKPHDPDLQYELALALLSVGKEGEALLWLQRALQEKPSHVPARWTLAEYYDQIGDKEQAAYHRRFLKTKPAVPNTSKK
jgi:tetratricopeptide (TPR) repeat protein